MAFKIVYVAHVQTGGASYSRVTFMVVEDEYKTLDEAKAALAGQREEIFWKLQASQSGYRVLHPGYYHDILQCVEFMIVETDDRTITPRYIERVYEEMPTVSPAGHEAAGDPVSDADLVAAFVGEGKKFPDEEALRVLFRRVCDYSVPQVRQLSCAVMLGVLVGNRVITIQDALDAGLSVSYVCCDVIDGLTMIGNLEPWRINEAWGLEKLVASFAGAAKCRVMTAANAHIDDWDDAQLAEEGALGSKQVIVFGFDPDRTRQEGQHLGDHHALEQSKVERDAWQRFATLAELLGITDVVTAEEAKERSLLIPRPESDGGMA